MRRTLVAATAIGLCAGVTLSAVASADPATTPQADVLAVAASSADSYVNARPADLFAGDHDTFQRVRSEHSLGLNFVSYERAYDGIPVVGGDFVIVTNDAGTVLYTSVAQTAKLSVDTTADRSAKASTAKGALETARLVVFAQEGAPALAYVSQVAGVDEDGTPVLRSIYTDADSGEELAVYDDVKAGTGNTYYNGNPGTVQFGTSPNGTSGFIMRDAARPGLSCAPQSGAIYTDPDDVWGTGAGTDLVTGCVDAMYAAGQEWDMLSGWLGRNGINGSGGAYPLYVNLSDVNAYWNGSSATFGHSQDNQRQLTSIDIVSHELGHAIFQTTPGGSSGGNETGGINEGTGDIFGALTEWWDNQPVGAGNDSPDYLVGEVAGLLTPGAPIRNMPNPGAEGDPNCWSTAIPGTEVHAAAGPINHWFYLTAEGTAPGGEGKPGSTTCNNTTIASGVGVANAGKIWMGALNGKTSSWTYAQARKAALNFAATTPLFTTCKEYNTAKAAFDGVSVPGGSDPVCSKDDRDFDFGVAPATGSVEPGGALSATVATTNIGPAQAVSFSVTVSPAETSIAATVSPSSVTTPGSATLNVSTTAATPAKTYTITVVGTGATGMKSKTFKLTVASVPQPGDPKVVFGDDFSADKGWTVNAAGTDTATAGPWERGDPAATNYAGTAVQRGDCATESTCLVTGASAGTDAGGYDLDGGTSTVTSPAIAVPAGAAAKISLKYYLAHLNNASSADGLKVTITAPGKTSKVVLNVAGSAVNKPGAWLALTNADISEFAGATIRIVVSAADGSAASLVEAAVDDVQVVSG